MALSMMLLPSCLLAMAGATVIGDMDQGANFTQCVTISDFETKTLSDDITLVDRNGTTGCCPSGSVPGAKFFSFYQGAQIVCGFQDDGTVSWSVTSGSCEQGSCYVMKQNIECSDGSRQFLNGCCEGTTGDDTGFPISGADGCRNYYNTPDNADDWELTLSTYCITFATNAAVYGNEGTIDATDDQADGVLQVDNIITYAACPGSEVSDRTVTATTGTTTLTTLTTATTATTGTTTLTTLTTATTATLPAGTNAGGAKAAAAPALVATMAVGAHFA